MANRRKTRKSKAPLSALIVSVIMVLALTLLTHPAEPGGEQVQEHLPARQESTATLPKELPETSESRCTTAVHFIDVGQGDAILVECGGQFALIDAGTPDCKETLLSYLSDAGVEKLALVVMTHPHADHIGSMRAVLEAYSVEVFLLPDLDKGPEPTTATYAKLLNTLEEQEIPTYAAAVGDTYPLGDGLFTVVGAGVETDDLNDVSTAIRFDEGNFSLLVTGDGEKPVEKDLLESGANLKADVFKAAHHGSETSNTQAFLETVDPDIVVVSCGEGNSYGHPHREPMERFAALSAEIYRTDIMGTVVVCPEGDGLAVYTEREAGK